MIRLVWRNRWERYCTQPDMENAANGIVGMAIGRGRYHYLNQAPKIALPHHFPSIGTVIGYQDIGVPMVF